MQESRTFRVTEIMSFKRCKRQWWLTSSNGLRISRIVPSAAFSLGTAIHETFRAWLPHPEQEPVMLFMAAAEAEIAKVRRQYHARNRVGISDVELGPMLDQVKFGARMMDNYKGYWGSPLPDDCVLVAQPEQEVRVPIPGTPHFLQGHIDAIIKNKFGKLLPLDHKTYEKRVRLEVLHTNEQFIAYIWIMQQLDMGPVGGLAYDGMWKRTDVPKGRVLDDLFWREKISPPDAVLAEYGRELAAVATEMASDPYITHARTWNGSCFYGCGVEQICNAMSRDENFEYLIQSSEIYRIRPEGQDVLEGETEKDLANA